MKPGGGFAEAARAFLAANGGGFLLPEQGEALAELAGGREAALRALVAVAAGFASPCLSGFRVGAAAECASGAIVLGANLEFGGAPLGETVHAEQAAVANAAARGETGLVRLAVSAPPCGYCRQFLWELAGAGRLEILLDGGPAVALAAMLPGAFGPADLGLSGGMLDGRSAPLAAFPDDPLDRAAAEAAARAYAPYSGALAGAALRARDGGVFVGSYQENAAFNPSLGPVQAALAAAAFAGTGVDDLTAAAIAQPDDSRIDHLGAARALLARIAPDAEVRGVPVRRA